MITFIFIEVGSKIFQQVITQYGSTVYISGLAHYSVPNEILMITFSMCCRGLLTN